MCRNIRPLQNLAPPATAGEVHDAALQYVRKIAGTANSSRANADVVARAVAEVEAATTRLLGGLVTSAPPRDRAAEAEKARRRNLARFG